MGRSKKTMGTLLHNGRSRCDLCPREFKLRSSMLRHRKSHSQEQLVCPRCAYANYRSDAFRRHKCAVPAKDVHPEDQTSNQDIAGGQNQSPGSIAVHPLDRTAVFDPPEDATSVLEHAINKQEQNQLPPTAPDNQAQTAVADRERNRPPTTKEEGNTKCAKWILESQTIGNMPTLEAFLGGGSQLPAINVSQLHALDSILDSAKDYHPPTDVYPDTPAPYCKSLWPSPAAVCSDRLYAACDSDDVVMLDNDKGPVPPAVPKAPSNQPDQDSVQILTSTAAGSASEVDTRPLIQRRNMPPLRLTIPVVCDTGAVNDTPSSSVKLVIDTSQVARSEVEWPRLVPSPQAPTVILESPAVSTKRAALLRRDLAACLTKQTAAGNKKDAPEPRSQAEQAEKEPENDVLSENNDSCVTSRQSDLTSESGEVGNETMDVDYDFCTNFAKQTIVESLKGKGAFSGGCRVTKAAGNLLWTEIKAGIVPKRSRELYRLLGHKLRTGGYGGAATLFVLRRCHRRQARKSIFHAVRNHAIFGAAVTNMAFDVREPDRTKVKKELPHAARDLKLGLEQQDLVQLGRLMDTIEMP